MTQALSREAILATPDAGRTQVEVPEWGGYVWVHVMSGTERDRWETDIIKSSRDGKESTENTRAKLIVLTVRDDNGTPLFTSADVEALGRKHYAVLDRVIEESRRINRLTVKSMEELEGNSAPVRSDGQSSDSQ
jgi:hypothetical protein